MRIGAPVVDNQNTITAGPGGTARLQDVRFLEKLVRFDREVIPERRMHAKGSGAYSTFTQMFVDKKGVNGLDFNK
jgi:catalase